MHFIYNKLAGLPSLLASFAGKELGKPVFLLLFLEVGSVEMQLKKDPDFKNQPSKCLRLLNQGGAVSGLAVLLSIVSTCQGGSEIFRN